MEGAGRKCEGWFEQGDAFCRSKWSVGVKQIEPSHVGDATRFLYIGLFLMPDLFCMILQMSYNCGW